MHFVKHAHHRYPTWCYCTQSTQASTYINSLCPHSPYTHMHTHSPRLRPLKQWLHLPCEKRPRPLLWRWQRHGANSGMWHQQYQTSLNKLYLKWREGYLLPTLRSENNFLTFRLNAPVVIRAKPKKCERTFLFIAMYYWGYTSFGSRRSVRISPPFLPPHHCGPATRDFQKPTEKPLKVVPYKFTVHKWQFWIETKHYLSRPNTISHVQTLSLTYLECFITFKHNFYSYIKSLGLIGGSPG